MGKIRARPNVHREEALPEIGNEVDIARMFEKLKGRVAQQHVGHTLKTDSRQANGRAVRQEQVVGSSPTAPAITHPGLTLRPTALTRESAGPPQAEVTASAGGELTRPHGPFPVLAIGPESEQSAVSMASNDKALTAAPCSTGQPRRILWDKPSPRTPDTRYSADLAYAVLREGAYPNYSYMPLKRGQEGTYAPLPGGLKPSFKGAAVRCEQDLHAT